MSEKNSAAPPGPFVTYQQDGDRTLITLEVQRDAVTVGRGNGLVGVEFEDRRWFEIAKTVLRVYNGIHRVMDADRLVRRLQALLADGVERALEGQFDPELHRRRAVANTLHRLAEAVLTGSAQQIQVAWDHRAQPQTIELYMRTPHREFTASFDLTPPPRSAAGGEP